MKRTHNRVTPEAPSKAGRQLPKAPSRANYVAAIHQQDPDLAQVALLLRNSKEKWTYYSNKSGVSKTCFKNWTSGKTRRPFNVTLTFAMEAMGYSRKWEKK